MVNKDEFLSQYDSYIIKNKKVDGYYGSKAKYYVTITLISNKWYKFNKELTYQCHVNYSDRTWSTTGDCEHMLDRCKKHFGY